MKNKDNSQKAIKGYQVKSKLDELLTMLENEKHVKKVNRGYSISDPSLKGKDHFKFDFKIDFYDDSSWIIHCTNSIRSDRLKGNFFEAEHIKRLNPKIENAFVVYPDNQSERDLKDAQRISEYIKNQEMYSTLEDVISFRGIFFLIHSKAVGLSSSSTGQSYAIKGQDFESLIIRIISDDENLYIWNNQDKNIMGSSYDWFYTILNKFGYGEQDKIQNITATKSIPKLPSGGKPKTDVSVDILCRNKLKTFNLSCKRVTQDFVTIHQYAYTEFIKALQIKEESLQIALEQFQKYGGVQSLFKNNSIAYEILDSYIHLYNRELINWAFFGIGGEGRGMQLANYIVTWNETMNSFSIHSQEQFIQKQLQVDGQFKTPFKWTYASKSLGKSIQLKGKV